MESELFGHENGGVHRRHRARKGKFESADGGTLFLDEIGEMPLEAQAKLLRVLQEKPFERVGGNRQPGEGPRNRRHQPGPGRTMREGHFREDLYYRLNVIDRAPPLRERPDDIPLARWALSPGKCPGS